MEYIQEDVDEELRARTRVAEGRVGTGGLHGADRE